MTGSVRIWAGKMKQSGSVIGCPSGLERKSLSLDIGFVLSFLFCEFVEVLQKIFDLTGHQWHGLSKYTTPQR